jgi:hypothetical protein
MKVEELKQHERGILNMFEDDKHLKVYSTQHNKTTSDQQLGKYVRLPSSDYN